jgi:hypothetical protein
MATNPEAEVQSAESQLEAMFSKQLGNEELPDDEPSDEVAEDSDEPKEDGDESTDDAEEVSDDQPEAKTDDSEEIDLDGEKFTVPKKVKEAVLRNKDYTQKTQELSSKSKIVSDREQYVEAREQFIAAAFKEAAELQSIETQLAQFDALDWSNLIQTDPQHAMRLNFAKQELQSKLETKRRTVGEIVEKTAKAQEMHKAKQAELGRAELARRLGNISDQDRTSMLALAQELGFDERDLMSPAAINSLALAAKYQTLQKSKPSIEKRVASAKPMQAPSARTNQVTNDATKIKSLQERYRKSGKASDVEAFFEQRILARSKGR